MNNYLILAWRNIWRNKRRTLITVASIFFALLFSLIMRSLQVGSYGMMTKSVLENYTGYIQIYKTDYFYDKSLDNAFESESCPLEKIDGIEGVSAAIPRLESFAMIVSGNQTKGVMVVGIDPVREKNLSNPARKIIRGRYFSQGESGLILTNRLARYLKALPGDTLTLLSQGYHGASAAGLFVVRGIISIPNPDLDRRMVYMDLNTCRQFYNAENMLTSVVINMSEKDDVNIVSDKIKGSLQNPGLEVLTYKENSPELIQQIESDQASGIIFMAIIYLIVGFGVFGTVLMMIAERRKEMGVMVAIGMQRLKLSAIVSLELLIMGLLGIVSSLIVSIPIIWYLQEFPIRFTGELAEMYETYGIEPIMPAVLDLRILVIQSLIVILIVIAVVLYLTLSILRLKLNNALRR